MATITLAADSNYSALTVANDDTIDLAGFELTIDVQPSQTGVTVETPGTAGTCVIGGAWDLGTWSFFAGTNTLINTNPTGAVIGIITGGTGSNVRGIINNYGTVIHSTGGSGSGSNGVLNNNGTVTNATGGLESGANGINTNNGTVTNATGGSVSNTHGINTNNGTVTNATGGSASSCRGVSTNNGTVTNATGGSANGAYGINANNGTVTNATGGSFGTAYGVNPSIGQTFGVTDGVARAVNQFRGSIKFISGPSFRGEMVIGTTDPLQTLYVLDGPLHADAVIPSGVTIVNAYGGTGSGGGIPNILQGGIIQ